MSRIVRAHWLLVASVSLAGGCGSDTQTGKPKLELDAGAGPADSGAHDSAARADGATDADARCPHAPSHEDLLNAATDAEKVQKTPAVAASVWKPGTHLPDLP